MTIVLGFKLIFLIFDFTKRYMGPHFSYFRMARGGHLPVGWEWVGWKAGLWRVGGRGVCVCVCYGFEPSSCRWEWEGLRDYHLIQL